MLKRLSGNERGQVLLMFVIMLPVMFGFAGFAVDVGLIAVNRRDLQNAADAAALAAVQELPDAEDALDMAYEFAVKNGFVDGVDGVTVSVIIPYAGNPDLVEVTITRSLPTVFMNVVGVSETDVGARAVASATTGSGGGDGYAFVALHPTACRALDKGGSGNIIITNGGGIMVNSSCNNGSNGALNRTGSGDINAGVINYYYEGTVTDSGSGNLIPPPSPVSSIIQDPLAGLPVPDLSAIGISPDSGGTAENPAVLDVGSDDLRVLRPGVYYGGIKVASGGDVIFEPGVYVLAGGGLAVVGSGDVTGNGVFFYNTNDPFAPPGGPGNPARCQEVNLRGSGNVSLLAPTTGPYANILIWQDVACTHALKFEGSGDAVAGVIYVPGARVDLGGSGDVGAVQFIASTFDIAGSGELTIDFVDYLGLTGSAPSIRLIE